MNEEDSDRVLERLDPPSGGWERLRSRREAHEPRQTPWLALAAGIGAATLGLVLAEQFRGVSLTLPSTAARLTGLPSADQPFRLLDAGTVSPLPATAGVRIYWTDAPTR